MKPRHAVIGVALLAALLLGLALWMTVSDTAVESIPGPVDEVPEVTEGPDEIDARSAARRARRTYVPEGHGTLVGRLLEYGTDRPLAGVPVRVEAEAPGPAEKLEGFTREDGSFRLERVPNFGGWSFVATPEAPLAEALVPDVLVEVERETDLGIVYVTPAFHVPGIVIDERGEPVEGARVRAVRGRPQGAATDILRLIRELPYEPAALDRTETAEDGTFTLTKLTPGSYDIEAFKRGNSLRVLHDVIISPDSGGRVLRIVLQAGFDLPGRVFRTDGGPLGGLTVVAFKQPGQDPSALVLERRYTTTDPTGGFLIEGLHAGSFMVTVHPEGRPMAILSDVPVPGTSKVEITIGGDAWLEGRVTGDAGKPISGADVYVARLTDSKPRVGHAKTDTAGRYRIDGLQSGFNGALVVDAPGYGAYPQDFVRRVLMRQGDLVLQAGLNRRDVSLGKGAIVRGEVIDRDEETPIAGVRISLKSTRSMFGGAPTAVSDEEGQFEIRDVPIGASLIFAEKPGWILPGLSPQALMQVVGVEFSGSSRPDRGRGNMVSVTEAGEIIERTVKLVPGAFLRGVVQDPDGLPIPGAQVSLEFDSPGGWADQLMGLFRLGEPKLADSEGKFTIAAPPPAQGATVVAKAQGFLDGRVEGIKLRPGEGKDDMVVKLRQGAVLEGKVTGGKVPLAGAQIRYVVAGDNEWTSRWGLRNATPSTTRDDGTFRIANVPEGKLIVQASHPDYLSGSLSGVEAADGKSVSLDFSLVKGLDIEGRVFDASGQPVGAAKVSLGYVGDVPEGLDPYLRETPEPVSDSEGRFSAAGLVPGRYSLSAEAEGAAPGDPVEATAGGDPVTLRLAPAYEIAGTVRGPDGGPLGGMRIQVQKGADDQWSTVARERSGADGAFEVRNLPAGSYRVRVEQDGGSGSDAPNVLPKVVDDIQAGTRNLLVELSGGELLQGRVVAADGTPLERAWGSLSRVTTKEDPESLSTWTLILDGVVDVSGLLPGEYDFTLYLESGGQRRQRVKAGTRNLELDLAAGGTLRGLVLAADGSPAPEGTTVVAVPADGANQWGNTDAEGRFEINGLAAGTYQLSASRRDGDVVFTAVEEGIELRENDSVERTLTLVVQ